MGHPIYYVKTFKGATTGWQLMDTVCDKQKADRLVELLRFKHPSFRHKVVEGFYGKRAEA